MNEFRYSKPLISAGWLRALLYFVTLFIVAAIAVSIYIIGFHKGSLDINGFKDLIRGDKIWIIILVLFVLTLGITYVFRRWVDRQSFLSLGLDFSGHGREAVAGGALAVFIICAATLLLKATGHLKWMDILFDPKALFMAFGSVVLIAFYEELIFRGYLLSNLLDSFQKWAALVISAFLFMIFHWTSFGILPLINTLILGLILGLNYIYTRNLWFSICFHIGWNFFQGPVLGFSGDESFQTLLQTELIGDANITGGTSGLEGSFILTGISLFSLLILYFILQKKLNLRSPPVPGRI